MLKTIIGIMGCSVILLSCNHTEEKINSTGKTGSIATASAGDCDTYYAQAKASDEILMRAQVLDKEVAAKAINDFSTYASHCKNDSLAPVFYLKAGQVAQAVGKYTQSQVMLNKCINEYPRFKNRGAALFIMAQLYDDPKMLNNEQEAKKLYEQIINECPETAYANDSKAAIHNLGKTDEELVQEFIKKNK